MAYAHPEGGATVPSRKGADQDAVILREFKRKLAEDEGYISYFSERLAIEQQYIDQLNKLHGKTVSADVFYDDVPHPRARVTSSARRAWFEVRDYTQREIQAREAMVNALKIDVLDPLVALRDTQTRIRNRIREDLKTATESYEDYAFTKVPKMQRTYKAKTQAVEDFKRQEHAIQMQAKLLAEQSPKEPTESRPHPYSHGHSASQASVSSSWASGLSDMGGSGGTPPMSPQTQHSPHTAQPSISTGPSFHVQAASPGSEIRPEIRTVDPRTLANTNLDKGNRARSGSGSYAATMQAVDAKSKEVFSDIASHSKKGFAAIMQRLGGDRDGELATSGPTEQASMARRGSVRTNGAVKSAKIKREAEDADKQYRTGVFHLESLRLRREKLQRSAITSLGQFNDELNATLLVTMRAFTDVTHGSAATLAQLSQTPRQSLRSVNLEHDTMLFRSRLPVVQRYAPLLYDNYYVGKCRSLIFGVSLTDYDFARGEGGDHGRPPLIVEKCIAWIDALGFEAEGIYRLSGRQATVRKLIQGIERDEEEFNFTQEDDVHSVAVVLKAYLRELPEPLFHLPHAERIKWTESREAHYASNFSTLRGRLRRLPPIHQTTFQAIIEHLNRVSEHHNENKMDARNLAVVFNSVLFGQEQADADALKMHLQKDTVLEDMISHPELLFGFAGEPGPSSKPSSTAGSARTKFEVRPQILQQTSNTSITGLSHVASGGHPSAIPVAQHPIATQHSRSTSWASQQLPLTPQEPINFDPPTHGPPVLPPIRSPPMHMTNTTPPLPAGAGLPFQPPHPNDPLSQQMSHMAMDPRPIGLDNVLNGRSGLTPDAGLELLFDKNKIPASMRAAVPDDFHVRPLASDDFLRAHFGLLSHLSASPALAPSVYTSLFKALKSCADTYYIVVIVERATDQIVASGTVIKERKFIHGGGFAGHIEDIVVGPTAQGKGLGVKLVTGLRELATSLGCYKTILDCQEPKVPFYEKCGFTLRGRQMAYYVPTADAPPRRESLANTGMGHSHPPTPARLPPLPTGDEEDGNDSSADTVETGETGDTEGTGVTYRFPTSGATTNLAGVAAPSPTPLSPTSTGTGTETTATVTRADSVRRQESSGSMTPL